MALSLTERLQSLFTATVSESFIRGNRIKIATVVALGTPLLFVINSDYRAWLSLGKAGVPHNIIGYLIQTLLRPLRPKRFDTSVYDNPKIIAKSGPPALNSYLRSEDILYRQTDRPQVCKWLLPQRQLDEGSSESAKSSCEILIRKLASENPSSLSVNTSILERSGLALFIKPDVRKHDGAHWTRNEIAHVHSLEGSMHVSLAPQDAKLVIERGWGERFGLSGSVLPVTYVMVYAPRQGECEEGDVIVIGKIIRAAVKFMLGESIEE